MTFRPLERDARFAPGWGSAAAPAPPEPGFSSLWESGLASASANDREEPGPEGAPGPPPRPAPPKEPVAPPPVVVAAAPDEAPGPAPLAANSAPPPPSREEVLAPLRAELEAERARARAMLGELQALREALIEAARRDMAEAVWAVLHRVLLAEVRTDRGLVERIVESIADDLTREEHVVLRVGPRDYAWLSPREDDLARRTGVRRMKVEADRSLDAGGCVLDASFGRIDASIRTQLEAYRVEIDRFKALEIAPMGQDDA